MPLRNGNFPPRCVNHPEQVLHILNTDDSALYSIMLLAKEGAEHVFTSTDQCNVVNYYGCPICGYCEAYLVPFELEELNRSLDKQNKKG